MDYGSVESWQRLASALVGSVVPRPGNDCGLVECEPGWSWNPRTNDFDLWLVLAGHGNAQIAGQSVDLVAGTMVVLRPGDTGRFQQERDHPLTVAYCHFDLFAPGSTQAVRVTEDLLPSRVVRLAVPAIQADQMRALIRHASDPHPLVAVERTALLTTVLLDIYRQDAAQQGHPVSSLDPRIQRVVGRIRARPGQRMSLAAASELAELSPSYFSRLFTVDTGMSFREFCLQTRLQRARMLLDETTMSITEIAVALGYEELYLFSRQVRDRFGVSPSHLRGRNLRPAGR